MRAEPEISSIEAEIEATKNPVPVKYSQKTREKAVALIEKAQGQLWKELFPLYTYFFWHLWYWEGYYPEIHKDINENGFKGTFDRNQYSFFNYGDRTLVLDGGDMKVKIYEKFFWLFKISEEMQILDKEGNSIELYDKDGYPIYPSIRYYFIIGPVFLCYSFYNFFYEGVYKGVCGIASTSLPLAAIIFGCIFTSLAYLTVKKL